MTGIGNVITPHTHTHAHCQMWLLEATYGAQLTRWPSTHTYIAYTHLEGDPC